MTVHEKQQILENIHRIEAETLFTYIKDGQITFDEMRETGRLSSEKQKDIRDRLSPLEHYNKEENDFWDKCVLERTVKSFNRYKAAYPNGRFVQQADAFIMEIIVDVNEQKQRHINKIKSYPEDYTPASIKKLFDDGILDENDLISENVITERALRLYLNPPKQIYMDQQEWRNLPPIPAGNTDVYFFGIPGSGKSCVLAGMLWQANRRGILEPDISSPVGYRYLNELQRCIDVCYVPASTSNDTVNYLSFALNGKKRHNVSVIEMSGEFFNRTHEMVTSAAKDGMVQQSISANGYLTNNNRKSIFFVIDYSYGRRHGDLFDNATQGARLMSVLQILAKDGTLAKTDSVQIIISKSDLMPEGITRTEHARDFLKREYLSFMNLLSSYCKEFGINSTRENRPVIQPFSLGRFMLGTTFEFKADDSDSLVDSILNLTASTPKKPWFKLQ